MNKRLKLAIIITPIVALAIGGAIYALPNKKSTSKLQASAPQTQAVEIPKQNTVQAEPQTTAQSSVKPVSKPVAAATDPTPAPKTTDELKAIAAQVVTSTWTGPDSRPSNDTLGNQIACFDKLMDVRFSWSVTEIDLHTYLDTVNQRYQGYYCGVWGDGSLGTIVRGKQIPHLF